MAKRLTAKWKRLARKRIRFQRSEAKRNMEFDIVMIRRLLKQL